jgi:hypothetical protein
MDSTISVVILCQEHGRTLSHVMDGVARQTRPATEVIVVDSSSSDLYTIQTLASLRRSRVAVFDVAGPAAARNLGARRTSGDYLVLLEAASVPDQEYLAKVGGYLDSDSSLDFVCGGRTTEALQRSPHVPSLVDALSGALSGCTAVMIRRRVWEAVGGYDEQLSSLAEMDFWISALRLDTLGLVFDDGQLSGSAGSRPHVLVPGLLRRVYKKHREILEGCATDVHARKKMMIQKQEDRRQALENRRIQLEQELGTLRADLAALTRSLTAVGAARVEWGDLRRLTPLSPVWGSDRGKPLNRYYIEKFLAAHGGDIKGCVVEVKDSGYTDAFGADVCRRDVLDVNPENRHATIVADLSCAHNVPSDAFDCFILTQVLNVIWDVRGALTHAVRILRPGGVLLCTVAAVDRVSYEDRGLDGDYWRFTEASLRALLASVCPHDCFEVTTYGNVMACAAHLYGVAAEELEPSDLDENDPAFPLIVAARVVKPTGAGGSERE